MTGFAPRNRTERALVAIASGSFHPSGYMFAPMPPERIERVALLFRRCRRAGEVCR